MIEEFERLRDAICAENIQHDTEIRHWDGAEPLKVGHIVTFEADCWDSVESGTPALVLALGTISSGEIRAQLASNKSERCYWMRFEHIRPLNHNMVNSNEPDLDVKAPDLTYPE